MLLAAGNLGRLGIGMMSPQTATMNSAPPESRSPRNGIVWPEGAPLALASVEKLYRVLAAQIGR